MLVLGRPATVHRRPSPFLHNQTLTIVNTTIHPPRDAALDHAVSREKHLISVHRLLHLLPSSSIPTPLRPLLPLYPSLFCQSPSRTSFSLTPTALALKHEEIGVLREVEDDLVDRLRKLLMMTRERALPLPTVDQLGWDLGLPLRYVERIVMRRPRVFRLDKDVVGDERVWLRLVEWDDRLAISELERSYGDKNSDFQVVSDLGTGQRGVENDVSNVNSAFKRSNEGVRSFINNTYSAFPVLSEIGMSDRDVGNDGFGRSNGGPGRFGDDTDLVFPMDLEFHRSDGDRSCLAFPVRFTRGFGLKRKWMEWLAEWQRLPYTSPYVDPSGLDRRTDVSEKRNVGVFHEILHLTLTKKMERKNFSNLRTPFGLPQKFTKVLERHPGVFYLSEKLATQTVVLREAYDGGRRLLGKYQEHPLVRIREKYIALLRTGKVDNGD